MANLKEEAKWEEGIYQYELDDPLQGGEDGIDNVQGRQLANRTKYLKENYEQHIAAVNPHGITAAALGVYTQQQVDDIVTSLTAANNGIYQTLVHIFQNGYIQWPGMPSPLEDTSLHFEGYSWFEINYRGNFFRAKGENAKAFSAKQLTKEQIKEGAYIFQDDEQGDAIRRMTGDIQLDAGPVANAANGVFYYQHNPPWENNRWVTSGTGIVDTFHFDSGRQVPTAEESRSRNLTFTIWVLVKD